MSKVAINRILERLAEEAKQKEQDEFEEALFNLKPGALVYLSGESIVCLVAFTEQAANNRCHLQEPGVKHIVCAEDEDEYGYYSMFPALDTFTGMILVKGENVRCTCFFMYPTHISNKDLIVLVNERAYYVRLQPHLYKIDSERGTLMPKSIEEKEGK